MNKKVNVYLMYIIVFLQGFVFYGPIATLYRLNRNLSLSGMFLLERVLLSVSLAGTSGCDIALLYSSVKKDETEKVFGR